LIYKNIEFGFHCPGYQLSGSLALYLGNRGANKGGCFLQFNYVIVAHGVCILSISVAGRLSENNQPVDPPPISLYATFDIAHPNMQNRRNRELFL
jgi:hypothetical protein